MSGIKTGNGKHGLSLFLPLHKVSDSDDERMCWGYASTEAEDSEGEIVTRAALVGALPDYMKFANIREMHQLSAVGVAKEADINDEGLYIGAHVVDDIAWNKVKAGVYKGFSIGGRATSRSGNKITGLQLIEISLVDRPANPEALIDVWRAVGKPKGEVMPEKKEKAFEPPQIWSCGLPGHFHLQKASAVECMKTHKDRLGDDFEKATAIATTLADQISSMGSVAELKKVSDKLDGIVRTVLQDQADGGEEVPVTKSKPLAFDVSNETDDTIDVLADKLAALEVPKGAGVDFIAKALGCSEEDAEKAIFKCIEQQNPHMASLMKGGGAKDLPELSSEERTGDPKKDLALREAKALIARADKPAEVDKKKKDTDKPYGDVEYADPGYQSDGKKRYPIDTEEHIRAAWNYINKEKNSAKYTSGQVSSIKGRIVAAWKKHIDKDGPPSASEGKNKEKVMPNTTLEKLGHSATSMSVAKGIYTVIDALSLLKQMDHIKDHLIQEAAIEGDGSDMPDRWTKALELMSTLTQDLAQEEIREMLENREEHDFAQNNSPVGFFGFAAKAIKASAIGRISRKELADQLEELIGDDTGARNFLALSSFVDDLRKAKGSLSIEDWTDPGDGTSYGSHSKDPNDAWGAHGDTAQKVHDLAVSMGAKCEKVDTKKTHNDIPGATGEGDPKAPPKEINTQQGSETRAKAEEDDNDDDAKKARKPSQDQGMRGGSGKDPDMPEDGKKKKKKEKKSQKSALLEKFIDHFMDIQRASLGGTATDRDPPRPNATFKTVAKEDDFEPASGGDKGTPTSKTTKSAREMTEAEKDDVLKAVFENPKVLSRS